ncbi:unnamed protein product [Amoebophrya sp. A25]|nr:unnamed protein product [Amoebophrya sp. A25]|eukprot:GSA25T00003308001.1
MSWFVGSGGSCVLVLENSARIFFAGVACFWFRCFGFGSLEGSCGFFFWLFNIDAVHSHNLLSLSNTFYTYYTCGSTSVYCRERALPRSEARYNCTDEMPPVSMNGRQGGGKPLALHDGNECGEEHPLPIFSTQRPPRWLV